MSLSAEEKVKLKRILQIQETSELQWRLDRIEQDTLGAETLTQISALLEEIEPILHDTFVLQGGNEGISINEGRTREIIVNELKTLLLMNGSSLSFGFTQLIPT